MCALEGCDQYVVRQPGGGRPRLYCSDRHRAEARRRRLAAGAAPADDDPVAQVRRLLREALTRLDQASAGNDAREGARLTAIRAEATGQVLEAQQLAADAARRTEAAWSELEAAHAQWAAQRRALLDERQRAIAALDEATGALDGTRAALDQELVRHHGDVEELTRRLQVQAAAHASAVSELETLRGSVSDMREALERAERRAAQAEAAAHRNDEARRDLDIRAARAGEQAKQMTARVRQLESDLKQSRKDLVAERRQRGTIVATLRRELASAPRGARRSPPAERQGIAVN